nr:uncharacterized protein LOC129045348 [Mirounga angustirostris]
MSLLSSAQRTTSEQWQLPQAPVCFLCQAHPPSAGVRRKPYPHPTPGAWDTEGTQQMPAGPRVACSPSPKIPLGTPGQCVTAYLSSPKGTPLCHSGQRWGHTQHLFPSLPLTPESSGKSMCRICRLLTTSSNRFGVALILACLNLLLHCPTPSRSFLLALRKINKKQNPKSYRLLCDCRIPAACLVSPASPPPTPAPTPASALALTHGGSLLPQGLCTCPPPTCSSVRAILGSPSLPFKMTPLTPDPFYLTLLSHHKVFPFQENVSFTDLCVLIPHPTPDLNVTFRRAGAFVLFSAVTQHLTHSKCSINICGKMNIVHTSLVHKSLFTLSREKQTLGPLPAYKLSGIPP